MKTSKLFRILAIGTMAMALSASHPAMAQDYWGYSTDDPQQDAQIQPDDTTAVIDSTAFDSSATNVYDSTADNTPYYTVNNYYYGDYFGDYASDFIMPDYYQLYVVPGYANGYYYGYDGDDYPDNDGYYYWGQQNDADGYDNNANGMVNQGRTIGSSRGYGNKGGNIVSAPKPVLPSETNAGVLKPTAAVSNVAQLDASQRAKIIVSPDVNTPTKTKSYATEYTSESNDEQHTYTSAPATHIAYSEPTSAHATQSNNVNIVRENAAPQQQNIARVAPPQENYSRPQPAYTAPSQPSFQAHSEPPAAHESFIAHASAPQSSARPGR